MNDPNNGRSNGSSQPIPAVTSEEPNVSGACCKVERVAEAYGLSGVDKELRRRYETGDATLHELAEYVNNRITAVTLDAVDNPLDAEPATVRAALQGEKGILATRRDDMQATLAGRIDIEILTDSYISHETVRRHLNEHLDVSTSRGGFDTFDEFKEALNAYQEQYENGVKSTLERASKKELIDGGQYRIFSTRVECQHCSETYRLQELVEDRGCSCQLQG
jgi:hypothetical protein